MARPVGFGEVAGGENGGHRREGRGHPLAEVASHEDGPFSGEGTARSTLRTATMRGRTCDLWSCAAVSRGRRLEPYALPRAVRGMRWSGHQAIACGNLVPCAAARRVNWSSNPRYPGRRRGDPCGNCVIPAPAPLLCAPPRESPECRGHGTVRGYSNTREGYAAPYTPAL